MFTSSRRNALLTLVVLFALSISASCNKQVEVPQFDSQRAFEYLEHQLTFGARVPGSEAHSEFATWLTKELSSLADSVTTQSFTRFVPLVSDSMPMMNIVAHFNSAASSRIILGAHWDCRAFSDRDRDASKRDQPVMGANDGASGVAVLLEIAQVFSRTPPPMAVDLVFLDGEDQGRYQSQSEWALGSVEFVDRMTAHYEWGVILDMVGEKGAEFRREGHSAKYARPLQDKIWKIAAELGESSFVDLLEEDIQDDHVAFLMRGIPMVDIIDIRYPAWHTTEDTADKCSAESLNSVGRVVLHLIYSND